MSRGYSGYLKSEHWKRLRGQALEKAGRRCELCKHPHLLEVHHLMYRKLLDVTTDDLMVLCAACHSRAHSWISWGEIVNGETSDSRRHVLVVRFCGEMNHRREIRRREEPVPKPKRIRRKKLETQATIDPVRAWYPRKVKISSIETKHLIDHGNGVWFSGARHPDAA